MKRFVVIACLFIASAQAEGVYNVHDGDTFNLTAKQTQCIMKKPGPHQAVRLWGIDAPELAQPGGIQSRDALAKLIDGKNVQLICPS